MDKDQNQFHKYSHETTQSELIEAKIVSDSVYWIQEWNAAVDGGKHIRWVRERIKERRLVTIENGRWAVSVYIHKSGA